MDVGHHPRLDFSRGDFTYGDTGDFTGLVFTGEVELCVNGDFNPGLVPLGGSDWEGPFPCLISLCCSRACRTSDICGRSLASLMHCSARIATMNAPF